ncbi:hypothetical protein PLICRDRAFT_47231 [Plicaturopsis crispa FD-325 SS-3]|uniref:RecF/RecN/SMC N-terminal domain-containing protein n=1 Tax=Plicaturopsis crispa FD-325 SS-3 TaxID=944288 RepID=A0A0C9SVY9_PLICR|nr:hypothetical protein PLICRDRAFT_47231 [Plicaturopsis crispa FD-325 SS-3]
MSKRRLSDASISDAESGSGSASKRSRRDSDASRGASAHRSEPDQAQPSNDNDEDDPMEDDDRGDPAEERYRAVIEAKRDAGKGQAGTVAQHGIIQSVEMHQFMCHKRCFFKLGDQLNFIIGHNGSGKSAVLSAITIALGGKAADTGRGAGLKAFIREGQAAAEVSVTLKNEGDEAYRPDLFGSSITITRRFTKQGSSSFKIRNHKGATVGTKRADLDAIIDCVGIQVDNPLNILTQDHSREFIRTTKPTNTYALFMKGTQLQQLEEEYELVQLNIGITESALRRKSTDMPALKDDLERAVQAHAQAVRAQEQRATEKTLMTELAWAYVAEQEQELQDKHNELAGAERRVEKVQERIDEAKARVDETSNQITNLEARHNEAQEASDRLWKEREAFSSDLREKRKETLDLRSDEREINQSLEDCNRDIERLEHEIAVESQNLETQHRGRREEIMGRLEETKSQIVGLEANLKDAAAERDRLKQDILAHEAEAKSKQQEIAALEGKVRECDEHLSVCRSRQKDRLAAFGKNIPGVIADIQRERWFGNVPIGPLGTYVNLQDPQTWAEVMRIYVGWPMLSFAITDARDRNKLKTILVRHENPRIRIIISQPDIYDYEELPEEFLTPLRLLRIQDDYVRRIFINSSRIEQTYVTHTQKEAEELMNLRGKGVVVTADKHKVTRWADGGRKSEAYERMQPRDLRMQLFQKESDVSARIRDLNVQKERHTGSLLELSRRVESINVDKGRSSQALQQCMSRGQDLDKQLRAQKANLQELELEAQEDAPIALAAKLEFKKERETEKENLIEQFKHLQTRKVELETEIQSLQTKSDEMRATAQGSEDARQVIAAELEGVAERRATALHDHEHFLDKLQREQESVNGIRVTVEDTQATYTNYVESAEKFGAKVDTESTVPELKRQLAVLKAALQTHVRQNPKSVAELHAELRKARETHEKATKEYRGLLKLTKALRASLVCRWARWTDFRAYCSMSCKIFFQYHLSARGYYGRIDMDHEEHTLKIKVQKDDQVGSQRLHDPASLSGGEKSYSTICLLLALWETVRCPLRCLDEFDVCMDAVNRRTSMKMMIDSALASNSKQYIFITPQDMTNIRPQPGLKVLRMDDPERRQPS